MKKYLLLALFALSFLPSLAHGDDIGFKAKFEKIPVEKVDVKGTGIETKEVKEETVDDAVRTTGQIEELPSSHFDVNSPVQGKVISVLVDLGTMVNAGQSLAVIQSTDIAKLQSELDQSEAELELAKNNFDREEKLFGKGISAKKDLDAAKAFYLSTEAKAKAAKNNLKILTGQNGEAEEGTFTIRAPKAGTIVERDITVGQIINENQRLFHGYDLTKVWASADIYERDRTKVSQNQKAIVFVDGIPDKTFTGNISYIGSVIQSETRTLPVKALLDNKENILSPGAFIQLHISTGKKKNSIVIPRTALVEIDKEGTEGKHKHIVYLKKGGSFIPRKIEVEAHDSDTVEVISGLMAGEIIVTKGAYQLQFGEGGHDEDEHGHDKTSAGHKHSDSEDEHSHEAESENHEHVKREPIYPIWLIPIGLLVTLILGFILGKRKSKS
ncbi:MAG: hypothetical protein A3B68_04980 [Candidatus Melainabacteria bacterium RIFCSPHIGHO2_02_FULL_34_12]|nr:MAG: hypothetical protein A3B68_04980 [Candidatus Melainabacteria bacterium RIFCSPHIGHO2_02_FULL_34_12]